MLNGRTVNLRIIEKEDLPLLAKWTNDPEFSGEYESIEQTSLRELQTWYDSLHSDEKWFIIEKKDGSTIGQILYSPLSHHFRIGYRIIPSERKKGYCTEAVRIIVDYLFLSKDIVRIQAETNPKNTASQRVLEKAGFKKEGLIRKAVFIRGEWKDGLLYSIIREEWKQPRILETRNSKA